MRRGGDRGCGFQSERSVRRLKNSKGATVETDANRSASRPDWATRSRTGHDGGAAL